MHGEGDCKVVILQVWCPRFSVSSLQQHPEEWTPSEGRSLQKNRFASLSDRHNFYKESPMPKRRTRFALLLSGCLFLFFGFDSSPGLAAENSAQQFWAFERLHHSQIPVVTNAAWARTPIDSFIAAAQQRAGLKPNPPFDRRRLIRRVYFDLIGLPPSPAEVEAFVSDPSPSAYEHLINQLLVSPHYGERWGRHWLDVARYADSMGYRYDDNTASSYAYRDFVIDAFNDDLPFDTFVRWQLAGDELAPDNPAALAATGFCAVGPKERNEGTAKNKLENRYNELDDIVTTTFNSMLALTVQCARCHNHKFDPISQREYYQLSKAFMSAERRELPLPNSPEQKKCLAYVDTTSQSAPSFVLRRGDFERKEDEVSLRFLEVVSKPGYQIEPAPAGAKTTFQRAALAKWITDPEAGAGHLLARVIVNRLWFYHFGEGLVRTPDDFGSQGDRPALPDLLDWLAQKLIADGWKLKSIHKLILLSAVYQQDSQPDETRAAIDPENRLWWQRRPLRLDAEVLRDSILAVSGKLNPTMHGPGVFLPVPPEMILSALGQSYPKAIEDGPAICRRSVYAFVKRTVPAPIIQTFDGPDTSASCGRRTQTTVAPQALLLMNDEFIRRRSRDFAVRVAAEAGQPPPLEVDRAFQLALGRAASADELERGRQFLEEQTAKHRGDSQAALTDFCQVLFGLNEFIYVE